MDKCDKWTAAKKEQNNNKEKTNSNERKNEIVIKEKMK